MSKPKQLFWIGTYEPDGRATEAFRGEAGVYEPIPARDLTPEETEALTKEQWECIDSPAGKRLYRRTEPDDHEIPTKINPGSGSSPAKSADTSL